jgi:RNA polymerase sigma-70 factor, ECF subfamily
MIDEKNLNLKDFPGLYDQYVRKIFNFIYYKTHHKETAEDLTSDTFTKAFKKMGDFDENKGKFSTWLYQIARNTVIDFYRAKKSYVNIDDVWDLAGQEDILRDLDTAQKLKEVKTYLKELDSCQREIVLLRVWEGMSYKEISEIVGRDEGNCRVIFSRTIKALKETMPLSVFLAMLLFV